MPDKKIKMTESKVCEVCGAAARQFCSSCRAVFYCSRDCQKKGWKDHKGKCKPISLESHPVYGRYLVATRDIKAGEVVLKEAPVIVGPKQRTAPICLGCHRSINELHRCSKCKYPLCSPYCEKSFYHKDECEILSKAVGTVNVDDLTQPNHAYDCVTPLRCILTKVKEPKKWDIICNLQSNYDAFKKTEIHRYFQINVVDVLKNHFDADENVDEKLIQKVCGILLTNSFELRHNGQKIRGLFPQASMLAHNCVPNAKHSFDEDLNIIIRTTKAIPKGEAVNITYTQTLWNTVARRRQLKMTKFFLCSCKRCSDSSELGTELGTLLCSTCGSRIRSPAPLHEDPPFVCEKCGHTLRYSQVLWGDDALYKELKELDQSSPAPLENFLSIYRGALHAGHRFFVETKYALIKYLGNYPGYSYSELTRAQIENKVEYCNQLLKVASVIDPGKSLLRGTLLFELQAAQVAMAKTLLSSEEITQEECGTRMNDAVKLLKEATEILKHEPEMDKGGLDEKLMKLSKDLEL